MRCPTVIFLALVPLLSLGADNLQVEDYLDYEQVQDAQISPDGSQIVFTRRWVDTQKDQWQSALWIMDADGKRLRFLVEGSDARWSPGGDRLLFTAKDDNDKTQLFVRWMKDGAVSQVTRSEMTPRSAVWSPDGRTIAFAAVVPVDDDWDIDLPDAPEGATWTKPPRILEDLYYRRDKVGFTEPGFAHLFVVPASSGTARQLTQGKWQIGSNNGVFTGAKISWLPDSRSLLFDGLKDGSENAYRRSHIYRMDVTTAEVTQLTREDGNWTNPTVSRDGRAMVFEGHPLTTDTYKLQRLYFADIDGGNQRLASPEFDHPVMGEIFWDKDNAGVYFSARQRGYTQIFRADRRGRVVPVTEGDIVARIHSLAADGRAAGTLTSSTAPADVHLFDVGNRRKPEQLTTVNADLFAGKRLGTIREMWFEAEDGNRAHGWMVLPPDFSADKKYPLMLEIHGGPFSMYRGVFSFGYQIYASHGFVVLYTNPRGSTGYGEAFSQAINHAYPSVDYLDLMAGVDAALDTGFIDKDRLYVGGCSGGGVLSSWMIGHTDRFAAAAVRCPVSNWISMLGTTDIPHFTQSFFKARFWDDPSKWLQHSSIMYVGNVTTPTIVMTGEQDMRTPMAQSEEYYAALKLMGVPTRLLRFNDQYHGTGTRPSNAMRTWLYMMSWYNQWDENGERKPAD